MIQVRNHRGRSHLGLLPKTENNQIHQKTTSAKADFGKITEIVTSSGELNDIPLLMPLLAQLSHEDRWFAWISPPVNLPRSLLENAGIDLSKVILLYPDAQHSVLHLAKKALSAGTCHAVISWAEEISEHEIKNLEQSAQLGRSNGILIRRRHHH
ncbi:cell division inhibitor SulA [Neptunomonas qingdaonensis]|uniref:Cell division inhibitor SulA n=1 Tax=Neptunomonas qingdaonensis TaxID=1045558 RepID=A0A1I2TBE8_9GAMM|nr:SulA-like leucine-rich domain-containing protein [Neptunomonas qingdaonensis]SFG61429.1 cell division inhibitor SulA [Neptunomonas qingdaonensis]